MLGAVPLKASVPASVFWRDPVAPEMTPGYVKVLPIGTSMKSVMPEEMLMGLAEATMLPLVCKVEMPVALMEELAAPKEASLLMITVPLFKVVPPP